MKLSDFFLFCSGVSRTVLSRCPESERIKHVSIGVSVLFTAILAALSSFFAFSLIFDSNWAILGVSLFWGMIIFNLDRYIIATIRKKGNFLKEAIQISPRILLSAIIALVVAKPLELQIFKSEIEQNLGDQLSNKLEQSEKKYAQGIADLSKEKSGYEEELKEYFRLKETYYQEYKCECDGTCGTGKSGLGSECIRKREKYEAFFLEYQAKETEIQNSKITLEARRKELTDLFLEDKETIKSNFSSGILARLNALNNLNSWAPWTITLLILLVEIAPVLTKLVAEKGVYDELLIQEEKNFKFHSLAFSQKDKNNEMTEKHRKVQETYRTLGKELTKKILK